MNWILLWFIPSFMLGSILFIFSKTWIAVIFAVVWAVILVGVATVYEDAYKEWKKYDRQGDHPCYEWDYCKEQYNNIMALFNNDTYIKIDFITFLKYFQVNNARYNLKPGYVVFDDENDQTDMIMVFPRRELRKYFQYRRDYLQGKQMIYVLGFVQEDINKMRDEAQDYLDKATDMFNSTFRKKEDT